MFTRLRKCTNNMVRTPSEVAQAFGSRNTGPIVRINPYELSVNDTDLAFMTKVYPSVGVSVDKFWWSAGELSLKRLPSVMTYFNGLRNVWQH